MVCARIICYLAWFYDCVDISCNGRHCLLVVLHCLYGAVHDVCLLFLAALYVGTFSSSPVYHIGCFLLYTCLCCTQYLYSAVGLWLLVSCLCYVLYLTASSSPCLIVQCVSGVCSLVPAHVAFSCCIYLMLLAFCLLVDTRWALFTSPSVSCWYLSFFTITCMYALLAEQSLLPLPFCYHIAVCFACQSMLFPFYIASTRLPAEVCCFLSILLA